MVIGALAASALVLAYVESGCSESHRPVPGSDLKAAETSAVRSSGTPAPPVEGSAPSPAGSSSAAPSASSAASAGPASFPPPPIPPPVELTKQPGDGEWKLVSVPGMDPPPIAITVIHPHKTSSLLEVAIAAIDLTRIQLGVVAGLDEPKSTTVPASKRTGLIAPAEIPRLVASTNGGFKRRHGNHGMRVGNDEYVPPNDGDCTVAMTKSGEIRIGTWSRLKANDADFAWFRQGNPCLVEDGAVGPETIGPFVGLKWGVSQEGEKNIRRSAYGISKDGKVLYYAIGNSIEPADFAPALVEAGIYAASQFDINYSFTRFVVYERDAKGDPVGTSPLMKDLRFASSEGWKLPAQRDFFYMIKKE